MDGVVRQAIRAAGEVLLTVGLVGLLWHRLPGRTPARAGVLALIIVAVMAALWFYVFPWAALHLPIDTSGFSG
jgi:hypothetical protein